MLYLLPFLLIAIGSAFEHEQVQYAQRYPGESRPYHIALWVSAYSSWATRVAIIIYIGFALSWPAAIAMFIGGMLTAGIIAGLLSTVSRRIYGPMGPVHVAAAAFGVWPACFIAAYFSLPVSS